MEELLKHISVSDIEKLKLLVSLIPTMVKKETVTLRVFIDEYENLIKGTRSEAYLSSVKSSFKHLIDFFEKRKPMREIELKDIENFSVYLQRKVKKGYTVYFRTLKAAFNKAIEWDYIHENYFAKIKLPKKQKLAPLFIDCKQLSIIVEHIKSEIVRNVIYTAFYTGMRLDEIVNIKWKNIDFNNSVITIGDDEFITKGRLQRFVPLCEEALIYLSAQSKNKFNKLNKAGYVFCKEDGSKFTGDYFSQMFKQGCKKANIDSRIHFHTLRHSFASNLAQKGVSLYIIKELLGHASISTTEIYSHLNMDSLREAVEKLGAHGLETRSERQEELETEDRRLETGKTRARIFKISDEWK